MMSRGEGILKIPRELPRIAPEKRGLTSPCWEPISETRGHDGFTRSLNGHTPDLLDSSVSLDPSDSSDPSDLLDSSVLLDLLDSSDSSDPLDPLDSLDSLDLLDSL